MHSTPDHFDTHIRDDRARSLYAQISDLDVIDAHEHLYSEAYRVSQRPDAVLMFQQQYPAIHLMGSGMPPDDLAALGDLDKPLDERWNLLRPHLPHIRQLALVRALMMGISELYGFDEVTDANYIEVTEAIQAHNRPGL